MASHTASTTGEHPPQHSTAALTVGSIGIVYGDIGTSPLYAMRESLHAASHGGAVHPSQVIGVVSLLLWLLLVIATFKYVVLILRADNRGEGGTLSLLALCIRALGSRKGWLMMLGIIGTSLFFGDSIITPAISVLSAVEGVALVTPAFEHLVIPVTLAILFTLFWFQRHGTAGISKFFAPVMLVWFGLMAIMGLSHIADDLRILQALSPIPGIVFLFNNGAGALTVLGSVFLAITGAEALYADMGHFGRKPIRLAWVLVVFPALALSYLGQGALVLSHPEAAANPFFLMAPDWALPIVVGMATLATVIASQAVITGAFSVAAQAVKLGLLPRLEVAHTSEAHRGQIYVPKINAILLCCVVILVVGFGSSTKLATAYGIAVTGEMIITTILAAIVFYRLWKWKPALIAAVLVPLLVIEVALLVANLTKFLEGGYLPIAVAIALTLAMWTWVKGTALMQDKSREKSVELTTLMNSLEKSTRLCRTPGTAVFLTAEPVVAPPALLHNLKHNGVLHDKNYIVTVRTANRPHVPTEEMALVEELNESFARVRLTFGYMDEPNVPKALRQAVKFDIMMTSFFLNRRTFRLGDKRDMREWQKRLYLALSKTASNAFDFYRLPSNRVVELGQQITL